MTTSGAFGPGRVFLGVDLAWRNEHAGLATNETGVAAIGADGRVVDAGWTSGVEQTIAWAQSVAGTGDAIMFVDAPLVVHNEEGQRLCETQVGQRYGRWKVSANTTDLSQEPRHHLPQVPHQHHKSQSRSSEDDRVCPLSIH